MFTEISMMRLELCCASVHWESLESLCWHRNGAETSQPVSWRPVGDTQLTLTKQYPLNGGNKIAMRLDAQEDGGGIINTGFWGIAVEAGAQYELSLYLRRAEDSSVSASLHLSFSKDVQCAGLLNIRLWWGVQHITRAEWCKHGPVRSAGACRLQK